MIFIFNKKFDAFAKFCSEVSTSELNNFSQGWSNKESLYDLESTHYVVIHHFTKDVVFFRAEEVQNCNFVIS
jgi:hypothetical protein